MKKILLATTNGSKLKPFKKAWNDLGLSKRFELVTLIDLQKEDLNIQEDTDDFEKDSVKKALAYAQSFGLPAISLDRGIEIPSLNNWPGTKTKEVFAGKEDVKFLFESISTQDLVLETKYDEDVFRSNALLNKIKEDRQVNSVYGIAIALPNGEYASDKVVVEGTASESLRLTELGYYYDWFFIPKGYSKTLSELTLEEYLEYTSKTLWPITIKIINFLEKDVI